MTSDRAMGFKGLKDLIDYYESLDKQELVEKLTLKNAQLLSIYTEKILIKYLEKVLLKKKSKLITVDRMILKELLIN